MGLVMGVGGGKLEAEDVTVLVALADHEALIGVLTEEHVDRREVRVAAADRAEQARATDHLEMVRGELVQDEMERRAEEAQGIGVGAPGDDWWAPQECPNLRLRNTAS